MSRVRNEQRLPLTLSIQQKARKQREKQSCASLSGVAETGVRGKAPFLGSRGTASCGLLGQRPDMYVK